MKRKNTFAINQSIVSSPSAFDGLTRGQFLRWRSLSFRNPSQFSIILRLSIVEQFSFLIQHTSACEFALETLPWWALSSVNRKQLIDVLEAYWFIRIPARSYRLYSQFSTIALCNCLSTARQKAVFYNTLLSRSLLEPHKSINVTFCIIKRNIGSNRLKINNNLIEY